MPANRFSQTPDWESHREAISRLYLAQNMTQNEVRNTLKQEYGFTIRLVLVAFTADDY
jgi:Clr5 domain